MFQALLCPSSGARDSDFVDHICRVFLGSLYIGGKLQLGWSSVRVAGLSLQPGHYSSLTAPHPNIQKTKNDTTNVVNNIVVASS